MSLILRIAAVSLILASVQAPAFAATVTAPSQAMRSCMAEAQWPVEQSAAWRYGGARVRSQMDNSTNAEVRAGEQFCRDLGRPDASPASLAGQCDARADAILATWGERGRQHADRTRAVCQAVAGA